METIVGRVVSYADIVVHKHNAIGTLVKEPYINMVLRADDGLYEMLIPDNSAIQDNVPVGSLILAKATFAALTVGTQGMYKLNSYRKINAD